MRNVLYIIFFPLPTVWAPYSLCRASLMCHQTTWGHFVGWYFETAGALSIMAAGTAFLPPKCPVFLFLAVFLSLCATSYCVRAAELLALENCCLCGIFHESESLRRGWVCSLALWRCSIRSLWWQRLAELLGERGTTVRGSKKERGKYKWASELIRSAIYYRQVILLNMLNVPSYICWVGN